MKLNEEQHAEIRSRYQTGETVSELLQVFGASRSTIYRILEAVPKRPQSNGPNAEVGRLYAQGLRGREIEKLTGIKCGSQWAHRIALGVWPQPKPDLQAP